MSEANVAVFRASVVAVNRGDWEAAIEMMDPKIVFIPLRAPVQGSHVGHDDVRRFVVDTRETFDIFQWQEEEIRDLGERVLALGKLRIRGRGSQVETEVPAPILVAFDHGLMTRFHSFADARSALEAAGLTG